LQRISQTHAATTATGESTPGPGVPQQSPTAGTVRFEATEGAPIRSASRQQSSATRNAAAVLALSHSHTHMSRPSCGV
jgi:hypothetical protein